MNNNPFSYKTCLDNSFYFQLKRRVQLSQLRVIMYCLFS